MFKTHRTYDLKTGVKNNTIAVFNDDNGIRVVYHETCVVNANNGRVRIKNGGWDTVSTRAVINRALEQICSASAFLFRKKNKTYLNHNGVITEFNGIAELNYLVRN